MDESRLQAYLQLIQALLSCPNGEEPQILQANSDLLDRGFLQACEAVAAQLAEEGQENGANFLRNLASQLEEFLGLTSSGGNDVENHSPNDYIAFLQLLLQTEYNNSGGDSRHIYAVLQANLDKLNLNFIPVIQQISAEILGTIDDPEQAEGYAALIENIAIRIYQFPRGSRADNLEIAIAAYEIVLSVRTFETNREGWAQTQNNLAIAYKNRIRGERADNIERAIACYQAALEVRTRQAFPQDWAMTQNNLATAYSDRIRGERADNIERAIAFYQAALEVYTREAFPENWATTQNNLATAYSDRIRGERADNIERAIAAYEAALEVRTRQAFPEQWATTQNNLAIAYKNRIRGERADNIERAIACYQAALEVYTREAFPYEWARTQNNQGEAYRVRIRGERADNRERAIACYQAALEVYTREAFPENWAMTQNNLAAAYYSRIRGERADNIERAIAAYEAALEVYTREAFPQDWAMTQNNLAAAYSDRIRGERADNIERAIAAYKAALKVRTRKAYPQNHAETLLNLGGAYQKSAKLPQAEAQTQLRLADTTFARAIDTVESIRGQIVVGGDAAKQKLAEEWNKLYLNMVEVCLELGESDRAIGYAERSKARNLVELLANRDLYPKGDIPQPILDELDRLRREIDAEQKRLEIQERTRNSYGGTISEERSPQINALQTTIPNRDRLNQLRQQLDELIARHITPIDPNFRLTQKVEPISYSEIQSLTSENTAILEWYVTGDKFLTFIITSQSPTPIVWQSSPEDLKALLIWANQYLTAYQTNKTQWRQELADRLESLAEIFHIDKLLSHIPPTVDRLVLIPHRFLHLFPLHALQGKRQKINSDNGELYTATGYLIDLFTAGVRYAPSCQLLQQAQTRQRQEFDRLFAVQNPTDDLDYTDIEVAAIRQHFHPSHVLVKNDASKANLEGHIPEPGVAIGDAHCAHFSCHGYFNFDNPLLSALLLADCYLEPVPPELDPTRHLRLQDGKALDLGKCLTLADLFALDLGACRLVVLSACETGFSDFTSSSDEYISLLSGLLVAGSPSVVGSLWAVNDLSTALLMMRFYENVKAGLSVAVALNQAQIWLRDAKKEQLQQWTSQQTLDNAAQRMQLRLFLSKIDADTQPFQSPDYWAAFCAIGQ